MPHAVPVETIHCADAYHGTDAAVQELCTMFTNTEFLSYIYRALGTKIGRRVQIDQQRAQRSSETGHRDMLCGCQPVFKHRWNRKNMKKLTDSQDL